MGCDLRHGCQALRRAKFQSTHPHGVRPEMICGIALIILYFNPRTRMGCDPQPRRFRAVFACDFNPRTRMGCDCNGMLAGGGRLGFQSTHPHGVRPVLWEPEAQPKRISIHAPAWGATTMVKDFDPDAYISIHAPAWGATRRTCPLYGGGVFISIHAPAWGATRQA